MSKIDLQGSHICKTAPTIQSLTRPLREQWEIAYFKYAKILPNGLRAILTDHPELSEYIYGNDLLKHTWFYNQRPTLPLGKTNYFWAIQSLTNSPEQNHFGTETHRLFGLKEGITFILQHANHFEIFDFAAQDAWIYKISPSLFTHFMFYFKAEAHKLIERSLAERLKIPLYESPTTDILEDQTSLATEMPIKRFYLEGEYADIYLTAREIECLKLVAQGYNLCELALIFGISKRTAEHHIENIKLKLRCTTLSQAMNIATEQGCLFN